PQAATIARGRSPGGGAHEAATVAALREFLAEPRTTDEIRERVARLTAGTVSDDRLLDHARLLLPLVHAMPSGSWRQHGKFSLVLPGEPARPEPPMPPLEATAWLVRRYLSAYGPATRQDVAAFTWLTYRQLDPALAALEPLRRFTDSSGRELLDVPRRSIVGEEVAPPTRLLAKWDAALISHRDKRRIVPAGHAPEVFRAKNGEIGPCYLVDGLVAGTWRHHDEGPTAVLTLAPLVRGAALPDDLEPEALRMLALLAPDATDRRIDLAPA
ncbi:MAG: DNA glycosylase AlkZ-like family protein, partial [Acidimicrobiales bacterium]